MATSVSDALGEQAASETCWEPLHVIHVLLRPLLVHKVGQGCRDVQILWPLLPGAFVSEI